MVALNMNDLPEPIVVQQFRKSYLFGLISIYYEVLDRRPELPDDLTVEKFKHYISVKIFFRVFKWAIRSSYSYKYYPTIHSSKLLDEI